MKANSLLRHLTGRLCMAGLVLSAGPLLLACTPQVTVLTSRAADAEFHTITVMGRGEVTAKPDIAHASLGVEVTAPTVAEASSQAAARMGQILAALKRAGIAEKDIQTSNFSVSREQPDYGMPMPPPMPMPMPMPMPAPAPGGPKGMPQMAPPAPPMMMPPPRQDLFRVSNMVMAKIRDLPRVGAVLDAAVAAGANNIYGVHFGLDNNDAIEAQAREKAAADAKARAEALARLQGVTLAGVVSINEVAGGGGMPYPMPMPAMAPMAMRDAGTPVAPGEVSYATQVQVVYSIGGAGAAKVTSASQ